MTVSKHRKYGFTTITNEQDEAIDEWWASVEELDNPWYESLNSDNKIIEDLISGWDVVMVKLGLI